MGPDIQKIATEATQETEHLAAAVVSLTSQNQPLLTNSQEHADIEAMYNKTFLSVSKAIFLLSQWKSSFDATITASSVAEKATEETLDGTSIADVVASAAAVAAAQSVEAAAVDQ